MKTVDWGPMIRTYVIACVLLLLSLSAGSTGAEGTAGPAAACLQAGDVPPMAHALSDAPDDRLRPLRAEYFLDHTAAIGPDSIIAQAFQPRTCSGIFAAPLPSQALWLRFALSNPHDGTRHWVIGLMETIFDEVILFEEQGGTLSEVARTGRTVDLADRDNTAIRTGFDVTMQPEDDRVFYLRLGGTFAPTITAVIMSADLFFGWSTLKLIMTALFLGYVATIALFSLIVFRQIDVRFYQYYTLYVLCLFIYSFIYDGWLSKFFGVTLPVTTLAPVTEFFAGLGTLAIVQYCRVLLNVQEDTWVWQRLFTLLSAVVIVVIGLAVVDPWQLSGPLHLIYFISPLILLTIAIRKIMAGLPQAKPIACALLSLSLGLFIAVYFFIFPMNITGATYAYDLVLLRPLSWGYYLAIVGETLFMMMAISTMVRAMQTERRSAVVELATLGQQVKDIKQQHREAEKTTTARLEALETALADDPENKEHLSARQQFLEQATESVLDHIADQEFGVERLASALAVSQKTLGRRLKAANGQSPASFIRSVRLNFARNLILLDQYNTVAEVAHAAGFSSVSNFAKHYRQEFGEAPSRSISVLRSIQ
ncbi:helix-turn-helix domain-containing protein [uncultured Roseobacter sp.]|uniref:helix-turn-helix domain-containing protein n=1 Tax=uncultured Roseobacter sp. TaxID=114847 RepID=UPI002614AFEF|nr:helix-turn-helix domain-containing protein [uncultured Roseobacter sp.]